MKTTFRILPYLSLLLLTRIHPVNAQQVEELCKDNTWQHSTMCWVNPLKGNLPLIFSVVHSNYSFDFDYEKLNFKHFAIARTQQATDTPPDISFGLETYGKLYPCETSSLRAEDCQLIHTGRFLQHRFINWLPGLSGCDPYHSGLDIASWNDRLSLTLRVVPTVIQRSNSIVVNFSIPAIYKKIQSVEGWIVYRNPADGSGYVITQATHDTRVSASGNKIEARLSSTEKLSPGKRYQTGLIIYPVSELDKELSGIINQETNPLQVTAVQSSPTKAVLQTTYDPVMGWHSIALRNDISGKPAKDNNRMENIRFTIENSQATAATIRLNFAKDKEVYAIPGISGMIRDNDGYPTGIPLQLSKNWHTKDFNDYDSHLYRGPWFHGLTTLHIPAKSKVTLQYTGVNAHWGGLPAASHAQLSLVGWGSNQQWDQSAIGSWGESLCYEPDLDQASAAVLDIRPLYVIDPKGEKWNWTGNVGGADFFNLRQTDGSRAWHTAMKTFYKRYCPNLTEVTYQGTMLDDAIQIQYTTSLGRSDDMNRGIFKIRMDVMKEVQFARLDLFQLGAATYHYGLSKEIALGNEKGVIRKWTANNNTSTNIEHQKPLKGRIPWVFMYNSPISNDQLGRFIGGNRGFVIRDWKSKINGQADIPPYIQEINSTEGSHGNPCSIMTVTLPTGSHSLTEGDFIEAEIELFVTPSKASDYYGPNKNYQQALSAYASQWKLGYREAIGNHIQVTAITGAVKSNYPIVLTTDADQAHFRIKGGIGYVPVTLKGLSAYRVPKLYVKEGSRWTRIDQSLHGNDYWQTDFNISSGTWEVTYNINTDSPGDKTLEREFKFEVSE